MQAHPLHIIFFIFRNKNIKKTIYSKESKGTQKNSIIINNKSLPPQGDFNRQANSMLKSLSSHSLAYG
jgi:hypothetical protein